MSNDDIRHKFLLITQSHQCAYNGLTIKNSFFQRLDIVMRILMRFTRRFIKSDFNAPKLIAIRLLRKEHDTVAAH